MLQRTTPLARSVTPVDARVLRRIVTDFLTLGAVTLALFTHSPLHSAETDRAPNIVFILADDMGFGDVQTLNAESRIPTPNLNRLAERGMTFTDAHTPSAVCTPTRYGLVTGRYCWRSRLKRGVLNGYSEPLIEAERPTVASMLARAGYTTGIVGKWHLGLGFARAGDGREFDFREPVSDGPHTHGFDWSHIIPASLDFPPYLFIHDGRITEFPSLTQPAQKFPAFLRRGERSPDLVMEDCLDDLATQAVRFIGEHGNRPEPFFLYFALTAPHKPVLPHPRFRGRTELGPYGDFVMQVDATVGRVLEALEGTNSTDNTLVIYSSDNGSYMYRRDDPTFEDHVVDETVQAYRASHHTANGPFRGTKADIWEAGHHVPFFAHWPEQIASGSRCEETICLTDFYATAAELAGVELSRNEAPDSFSLLPLLKGEAWSTPRAPVIHHSAGGMFAIRRGPWKLVAGNGSGGREKPSGKPFERPYQLFNLEDDIGEQRNVIDQHPELAHQLEAELDQIREAGRSRP